MALDFLARDNQLKDHNLFGDEHFGIEPPCTMFEKRPLLDPKGNVVDGLYTAWITLNNPDQYGSYTTEMIKGVIAGMHKASMSRDVVATIFTGTGDRAFCTGGNVKEYAEYYTRRPKEYADYVDLFAGMVDAILKCRTPIINRCNGMRIAGGQEIGQACDLTVAADTANFGQAGTRHGSVPDGGSTDFLPWNLSMEQAMWSCISNEQWSAYKMERLGLIIRAITIKKDADGNWVPNPFVHTDNYSKDGRIVYGEFKTGKARDEAKAFFKTLTTDFSELDKHINNMVWTLANLMPLCLMKSIETIRIKKRFFWDANKVSGMYGLATNMNAEAWLGFNAFSTQKTTGSSVIDFIELRRQYAKGHIYDDELAEKVFYPANK
jgi:6-oxo-cyclohex-1-ene-carbonyl-CoA hydrolase